MVLMKNDTGKDVMVRVTDKDFITVKNGEMADINEEVGKRCGFTYVVVESKAGRTKVETKKMKGKPPMKKIGELVLEKKMKSIQGSTGKEVPVGRIKLDFSKHGNKGGYAYDTQVKNPTPQNPRIRIGKVGWKRARDRARERERARAK